MSNRRVLTSTIVVGATGLRGVKAWSERKRGYVTVFIDSTQICGTEKVDSGGDPEWNETFLL
jgi:hypothetical protein